MQEHAVLMRLPAGLGPTPLKFGNMGDGTALLVTPLSGRVVAAKLPPAPGGARIRQIARSFGPARACRPSLCPRRSRADRDATRHSILEDLAGKTWPICLQHGDLAPWNLRRNRCANEVSAFDWEYGILHGFPYLDLAYFILQVALEMYSWPPVKSAIYATQWLERQSTLGLTAARGSGSGAARDV